MDEDEIERWVYLDGPEPEPVRVFLDALRALPPATSADKARLGRAVFQRLRGAPGAPPAEPEQEAGEARDGGAPIVPMPILAVRPLQVAAPDPDDAAPGPAVAVPPEPPAPAASTGPSTRAPATLATTSMEVVVPVKDVLPFEPAAPAPPVPPPVAPPPAVRRPHNTLQSLGKPVGLSDTTPVGDNTFAVAMQSLPFVTSLVGDAVLILPRLTAHQYVGLCMELKLARQKKDDLMKQYGVPSDAVLSALHDHWWQERQKNPAVRAAYDAAVAEYLRWLGDFLTK